MDGISQFVWIFLLYNVCRIGPNAEVDGWNYYVRGPTTWRGPLHTQYKKHYSLVLLSTKTISQTCGESTIWTNVSGKCYSEIWLCYHIRYKNNVSRTGLIHPHSYTLIHASRTPCWGDSYYDYRTTYLSLQDTSDPDLFYLCKVTRLNLAATDLTLKL